MPTDTSGMDETVGMIFLILGLSLLTPAIIINLESPQERSFDQDVNERIVITGDLTSRVTVISNQKEVNVSMFNKKNGAFQSTGELTPGENATLVFPSGNVTVTLIDTYGSQTAIIDYVYPLYLGWPDDASLVVEKSPLIILLSGMVMILGVVFTVYRGVV